MHRNDNIFYKAVRNDEDHTTELLCNLFKYKYIRDALLNYFTFGVEENLHLPVSSIKYEQINTQATIDNTRPDIVIDSKECYCYFEIKTRNETRTQETQKEDYYEKLSKYQNGKRELFLIYLIPKNYNFIDGIKEAIDSRPENENIHAKIFYWEDFIRYIDEIDLAKTNNIISEFNDFVKEFLGKHDVSLTLNLEEMALIQNPKDLVVAKNSLDKLDKIISEISLKIQEEFNGNVTFDKKFNPEYGCCFYYRDDKNYLLFFGLWLSLLNEHPELSDYLLCFGVNTSKTEGDYFFEEKFINNFKKLKDIKEVDNWLIKKFEEGKYTLANDSDIVIEKVSETLIDTINELLK